jgi:hypothetical protein
MRADVINDKQLKRLVYPMLKGKKRIDCQSLATLGDAVCPVPARPLWDARSRRRCLGANRARRQARAGVSRRYMSRHSKRLMALKVIIAGQIERATVLT